MEGKGNRSKFKVTKDNVAKVVCTTSSEGFLVTVADVVIVSCHV